MNVIREINTTIFEPPVGQSFGLNSLVSQSRNLGVRTRETLMRMRERMANLELTLCQTVSENQQLTSQLNGTNEKLTLIQTSQYLTNKALEEQRVKVADLEAQLAAYRRKAKVDQDEIEALKTQLFA